MTKTLPERRNVRKRLFERYGSRPTLSSSNDIRLRTQAALSELGLASQEADILMSGEQFTVLPHRDSTLILDETGFDLFVRSAAGCPDTEQQAFADKRFAISLTEEAGSWLFAKALDEDRGSLQLVMANRLEKRLCRHTTHALCFSIQHEDQVGKVSLFWDGWEDPGGAPRPGGVPRTVGRSVEKIPFDCEVHLGVGRLSVAELAKIGPGEVLPLAVSTKQPAAFLRTRKGDMLGYGELGSVDGVQTFRRNRDPI